MKFSNISVKYPFHIYYYTEKKNLVTLIEILIDLIIKLQIRLTVKSIKPELRRIFQDYAEIL